MKYILYNYSWFTNKAMNFPKSFKCFNFNGIYEETGPSLIGDGYVFIKCDDGLNRHVPKEYFKPIRDHNLEKLL